MSRISVAQLTGIPGINAKQVQFAIEYTKDFDARRAATAAGYSPDSGYDIRDKDTVKLAVDQILLHRLNDSTIDAQWVLMEAVDNHIIARQTGNLPASNAALNLIAKHTTVDAMASDKMNINVQGDAEVMARLIRGRSRSIGADTDDEPTDEVSFF